MSNYGIQMPDGVRVEEATNTFARFVIQPLERGYGGTIGNSLRRVLLSSLAGTVVTALRIDGVQHEYASIAGVKEDVSDIILNLKGVRLKAKSYAGGAINLRVKGPGNWTARDLAKATNDYEVLNPGHHIATLAKDADFGVELRVETGRRYVPAAENKREDDPIGIIPVDAVFSPIRHVRSTVRPTRVGQRVDYESLELEVSTDGSILPQDALTQSAMILRGHINLLIDMEQAPVAPINQPSDEDAAKRRLKAQLDQSVEELELSVRAVNCLKAAQIKTIRDLVTRDVNTMLKFKNFGRKSLQELLQVLEDRGLAFGMDISEIDDE